LPYVLEQLIAEGQEGTGENQDAAVEPPGRPS
jgi:hypothetical protein